MNDQTENTPKNKKERKYFDKENDHNEKNRVHSFLLIPIIHDVNISYLKKENNKNNTNDIIVAFEILNC